MTLQALQDRLKMAEQSIKTLTDALQAERERARDRISVWDHYAGAVLSGLLVNAKRKDAVSMFVEDAAKVADAMMAERASRPR